MGFSPRLAEPNQLAWVAKELTKREKAEIRQRHVQTDRTNNDYRSYKACIWQESIITRKDSIFGRDTPKRDNVSREPVGVAMAATTRQMPFSLANVSRLRKLAQTCYEQPVLSHSVTFRGLAIRQAPAKLFSLPGDRLWLLYLYNRSTVCFLGRRQHLRDLLPEIPNNFRA